MGMINSWANDEIELEGFEDIWTTFRAISQHGIFSAAEYDVRNLHSQFCMVLSHKIVQKSVYEFNQKRAKLDLEIEKSKLLHTKYNDGTVSANNAALMVDTEYQQSLEKVLDSEKELIVYEAEVNALQTVVSALSRELSARLK